MKTNEKNTTLLQDYNKFSTGLVNYALAGPKDFGAKKYTSLVEKLRLKVLLNDATPMVDELRKKDKPWEYINSNHLQDGLDKKYTVVTNARLLKTMHYLSAKDSFLPTSYSNRRMFNTKIVAISQYARKKAKADLDKHMANDPNFAAKKPNFLNEQRRFYLTQELLTMGPPDLPENLEGLSPVAIQRISQKQQMYDKTAKAYADRVAAATDKGEISYLEQMMQERFARKDSALNRWGNVVAFGCLQGLRFVAWAPIAAVAAAAGLVAVAIGLLPNALHAVNDALLYGAKGKEKYLEGKAAQEKLAQLESQNKQIGLLSKASSMRTAVG